MSITKIWSVTSIYLDQDQFYFKKYHTHRKDKWKMQKKHAEKTTEKFKRDFIKISNLQKRWRTELGGKGSQNLKKSNTPSFKCPSNKRHFNRKGA